MIPQHQATATVAHPQYILLNKVNVDYITAQVLAYFISYLL